MATSGTTKTEKPMKIKAGKRVRIKKAVKGVRKRATKLAKKANVKKAVKGARKRASRLVKQARKRIKSVTGESTKKRAAQLTLSVIELQKAGFDNVIDIIGRLQEATGRTLHKTVEGISWVPGEGKQVVDEWVKTVNKGRQNFKRTTDRSFDLLAKFIRRIEKDQTGKKPPGKSKAAKKNATAKKAGPKKAAAKRTKRKRS